ncbi:unnamed protein product [Ixodes persulcatus]
MSSFMQRQFIPYAVLCRLGGCFFIPNFTKPLENSNVVCRSVYTAYSAFIILLCFSFQVVLIVQRAHVFRDFSHDFSLSLMLIVRTILNLKALLNAFIMATGSATLLEFFRKSSAFEKTTGFSPATQGVRGIWRNRWSFFRQTLVVIGAVTAYVVSTIPFIISLTKMLPTDLHFLRKLGAVIVTAYYLLYDALPYMVLRSCSAVLVEYLQFQRKKIERCCELKSFHDTTQLSGQLEVIRHHLGHIRDLKDFLNNIWQVPLAAMSAAILLFACVACYAMFHDGLNAQDIPLAVSFCVYSSLAFVDMTLVSQALHDEVSQRDSNITETRMHRCPASSFVLFYFFQLRFLHESIDPKDMCLSGGGFFRLNKPLLVSMTGSIITYTVILVQTSDKLTSSTDFVTAPLALYQI